MPEKATSQIPRDLRDLFDKGKAALQRNNLDYALTIYTEILSKEPAFFECREALRAAQLKKGGSTSIFKKVMGSADPLLHKASLTMRSNPKEALSQAERALNSDANNVLAHKVAAEAALALDLPKTAVISLEFVRRNSPKDRDAGIRLAEAYAKIGNAAKGESILAEMMKANPRDTELNMILKNLSANRTMDEGGYNAIAEGNASYRDILKDKDEAVSLEQEARGFKDAATLEKLIDEYIEKVRQDPNDLVSFRKLADTYALQKNYERALRYYRMLSDHNGGTDPVMERIIFDLALKQFDQTLEQLDKSAPDYEDKARQIEAEKDDYLLKETVRRAEKYPNDLGLRYELGVLYFKGGKISEAIQEFQRAQRDTHRRVQAMHYLSKCFAQRGMNDLAAKNLQSIIKEKVMFDDEKKELIYSLGEVLESMGKADEAVEQYKQIYEVDIGYRDVEAKVNNYYSSKG